MVCVIGAGAGAVLIGAASLACQPPTAHTASIFSR